LEGLVMFAQAFRDKSVWLSGHTGFKGAWLAHWLLQLGARVNGFALPPPTEPALFDQLALAKRVNHSIGDLRDAASVKSSLQAAQLSGAASLREIVTGLSSHAVRLYHVGAEPVRRSTFSDANAQRPVAVFTDLLAMMMKQAHRGLRRKLAETTYLIDATSARLNERSAGWAQFSAGVCGAKVHVIYDADADRPIYAAVTAAKVNDITMAKQMPIEPGATYVFDLGYYDYAWWAELDAVGCRIVSRFKSNTPLDLIREQSVATGSNILSDRIGFLPARQARSRRNPMQDAVREVRVATESGTVLRILSNDLDASAEEIADLYRQRWAIELFFRWVKQTLKITRFVGTSENAVRIQIAVALIAFLLLRAARHAYGFNGDALAFLRLVRANLLHKRPVPQLWTPLDPGGNNLNQMLLELAPC
jgi:IS4 transposase